MLRKCRVDASVCNKESGTIVAYINLNGWANKLQWISIFLLVTDRKSACQMKVRNGDDITKNVDSRLLLTIVLNVSEVTQYCKKISNSDQFVRVFLTFYELATENLIKANTILNHWRFISARQWFSWQVINSD